MIRLLLLLALTSPAMAQTAPTLGGASSFGQTWDGDMLDAAADLGVSDLRDELFWRHVEADGRFSYRSYLTQYPALMVPRGLELSLIAHGIHPAYDDGVTPYTEAGRAGFARYVAEVVTQFEAITSVEVGNEMNTASFVSGPMDAAPLAERAVYYTELLRVSAEAARAARPGLRILGAAAHSIPLAWFQALSDAGAPALMDSLVIHPYTTPPEQLGRQIALLRQVPGFEVMPIEVTEIGDPNPETAAATLVKYYCQLALHGVTRFVWYPLNPRGDGFAPLIGADHQPTDVGRLYRFLSDHAAGQPARDVAPDRMTYACQLGSHLMVIWGEPRAVTLGAGVSALGPDLGPTEAQLTRDVPLILFSESTPVTLGETVILAPQRVLADSFHDFAYPGAETSGFQTLARIGARDIALDLMPGQHTNGVPWTPYLGLAQDGMLRLAPDWAMPSMAAEGPLTLVHRYVAPKEVTAELVVQVEADPGSADGVMLTVAVNGETLTQDRVEGAFGFSLPDLWLAKGDVLEITQGPGASPDGDLATLRYTLRELD